MRASPEELKRRREARMADPVYRELVKRAKRAAWRKRKDEVNARRRAQYAAMTEEQREARREYRHAHEDRALANARNARYYAKHRDEVRSRQRRYYVEKMSGDPEFAARVERNNTAYAERCKSDPRLKALRSAATQKWKRSAKGIANKRKRRLAQWEKIAEGGRPAIASYMKHTTPGIRREFSVWYQRRLIDRTRGLGHIVMANDEEVANA